MRLCVTEHQKNAPMQYNERLARVHRIARPAFVPAGLWNNHVLHVGECLVVVWTVTLWYAVVAVTGG